MVAACAMAKSRGIPAAANAKAYLDQFIDYNYPNHADAAMYVAFGARYGFDGT
jgi:hypothetical protein